MTSEKGYLNDGSTTQVISSEDAPYELGIRGKGYRIVGSHLSSIKTCIFYTGYTSNYD